MAALPEDIIARIKEETDIVGLVKRYVNLTPAGASFKGLCPFHREKTPSFHVTPHLGIYKCFGCGAGGDAISFLMNIEALTFPEALETLARPLDIDLSRHLRRDEEKEGERLAFHRANEAAAKLWQEALWSDEGRIGREYLLERGFDEEILRRYEVGWAPGDTRWLARGLDGEGVGESLALAADLLRKGQDGRPFAYFRNRVIFPIRNVAQRCAGFGGRVIGSGEPKYLNSAESTYFNKGKLLYGFAASRISIARLKTAILVEGYLDLLALVQAGFSNVVATCGTAFTPEQAKILRRGSQTIVVLFDGDRAGLKAAVKTAHMALGAGLEARIARLPEGEDPASLLEGGDPDAMKKVLDEAAGYLAFLRTIVEERDGGREEIERALRQGLKSISLVDDRIRREFLLQEAADLFGIDVSLLRKQATDAAQDHLRNALRPGGVTDAAQEPTHRRRPDTDRPGGPRVLSLAGVERPRVEATVLAHALGDRSGDGAEALVTEGGAVEASSPEAGWLREELAEWLRERGDGSEPLAFVQSRWHERSDNYRAFISELLLAEEVPPGADHRRVIRDGLRRLLEDQQRRPSVAGTVDEASSQ